MEEGLQDFKAIFSLLVFLLANILVLFPLHVRILPIKIRGYHSTKRSFVIGLGWAPPLAVLLLLFTRAIDGSVLRKGIIGADGIEPLNIMALFISLAYIAISLDATGLIRFLAFYILKRTTSGRKLYAYLFGFFFVAGVIVGNDPVVLSGTAFLAYMTQLAGIIPPTAWITAQFISANIASTVLVPSNPTNLVLSGGFGISFITYTKNVIAPSAASALVILPTLMWWFGSWSRWPMAQLNSHDMRLRPTDASENSVSVEDNEDQVREIVYIPRTLRTIDFPAPTMGLVDPGGAIFGSILLFVTLATLLAASAAKFHVQVWSVTLPAAVVMFGRDVWWDVWGGGRGPRASTGSLEPQPQNIALGNPNSQNAEIPTRSQSSPSLPQGSQLTYTPRSPSAEILRSPTPPNGGRVTIKGVWLDIRNLLQDVHNRIPTVITVLSRLPYRLVPFALSMFVLVQALGDAWISLFSHWWWSWVSKTGAVGAVFGMYILAVVGCNFMGTNIGATILLTRVIQRWILTYSPPNERSEGAIYALALGVNFGDDLAFSASFSASLAGLLWRNILQQKGIKVKQSSFAKVNIPINLVAMLVGCGVLLLQVSAGR